MNNHVQVKDSIINSIYYFLWLCSPARAIGSSFMRFLDHTQRRATLGKTSSERVISPSQRHLPDNTKTHATDKHPCLRWDFFIYIFFFVSCASLFWYWTFNGRLYRIVLHAVDFSSRKNPTASVESEPAILGTRGQRAKDSKNPQHAVFRSFSLSSNTRTIPD
jgi:hypothetical protein